MTAAVIVSLFDPDLETQVDGWRGLAANWLFNRANQSVHANARTMFGLNKPADANAPLMASMLSE